MGQDAVAPEAAAAKAAAVVQEAATHKPLDYGKWERMDFKDSDEDEDSNRTMCKCGNPDCRMHAGSMRPPQLEACKIMDACSCPAGGPYFF